MDNIALDAETETGVVGITLVAKFKKEQIELTDLHPMTTILEVKEMLQEMTNVLVKRQKLLGLVAREGGTKGVIDSLTLDGLVTKNGKHQFILMGTPEVHIFVDPADRDDLPEVIDDFELDFTAGPDDWLNHVANGEQLAKFTEHTIVHLMNQPRPGKPLLVSFLYPYHVSEARAYSYRFVAHLPGFGFGSYFVGLFFATNS